MNFPQRQITQERWIKLSFCEQMANIGSEVERAIRWRAKGNSEYSRLAFERLLELLDLTIEAAKKSRLRELTRLRETLVDFFAGKNIYRSSERNWHNYFYGFNYAARVNKTI